MKILSIITKFQKLPWKKKLLHLEAFCYQLLIGLLLEFIPFRYIPKLFASTHTAHDSRLTTHDSNLTGHPSHLTPHTSLLTTHISSLTSHISTLVDIKNATWSVSRFIPWKNKCLIKSLSARKMLTGRGIHSQLSMGVTNNPDTKLTAHAWLRSGDFEVVEKERDYYELFQF